MVNDKGVAMRLVEIRNVFSVVVSTGAVSSEKVTEEIRELLEKTDAVLEHMKAECDLDEGTLEFMKVMTLR